MGVEGLISFIRVLLFYGHESIGGGHMSIWWARFIVGFSEIFVVVRLHALSLSQLSPFLSLSLYLLDMIFRLWAQTAISAFWFGCPTSEGQIWDLEVLNLSVDQIYFEYIWFIWLFSNLLPCTNFLQSNELHFKQKKSYRTFNNFLFCFLYLISHTINLSQQILSTRRDSLYWTEKSYVNNTIIFPSDIFKQKSYIFSYFNTKPDFCLDRINYMGVFLPIMPRKFIVSRSQIGPSEEEPTLWGSIPLVALALAMASSSCNGQVFGISGWSHHDEFHDLLRSLIGV